MVKLTVIDGVEEGMGNGHKEVTTRSLHEAKRPFY